MGVCGACSVGGLAAWEAGGESEPGRTVSQGAFSASVVRTKELLCGRVYMCSKRSMSLGVAQTADPVGDMLSAYIT